MTHTAADANTTFTPARAAAPPSPALVAEVQRVFSEVTRYPVEILEPGANIEEDLGIDSVKLGEILAALRERYTLPPMADLRGQLEPERLRTIAGVAGIVGQFSGGNGTSAGSTAPVASGAPAAPAPAPAPTAPAPAASTAAPKTQAPATTAPAPRAPAPARAAPAASGSSGSPAVLLDEVQHTFSEITRYPVEILEPDANLEEDLGIDSVKLGEIFATLRDRYGLPPMTEIRERITPDRMRSIRGIAGLIAELVPPVAAPEASPAPTPRRASGTLAAQRPERARRPFEGKIALVTGSGRGLGKEIARHLADLGATVVVNSFHSRAAGEKTTEEINAAGGTAVHVWASVANDAQRDALYDQIESRFGGLDYFISSSSNGTLAPIDRITSEDWEKAFRTNVVGLHQGALRAARLMQQRGGGRIVTLSMTASDRCFPFAACQGTVKAAIEALTRYLAVELAPHNIRVNCIKAGAIYGDVVNQWPDTAALTPAWEKRAPVGRMCRPSDVCALLTALLSDDLEFMTGSVVVLDGGHATIL